MTDRDLWLGIRQALLMLVDVVERRFSIEPRTAQLRKDKKATAREQPERS